MKRRRYTIDERARIADAALHIVGLKNDETINSYWLGLGVCREAVLGEGDVDSCVDVAIEMCDPHVYEFGEEIEIEQRLIVATWGGSVATMLERSPVGLTPRADEELLRLLRNLQRASHMVGRDVSMEFARAVANRLWPTDARAIRVAFAPDVSMYLAEQAPAPALEPVVVECLRNVALAFAASWGALR